jgi:P4 family phage/plasmid primase-like protien
VTERPPTTNHEAEESKPPNTLTILSCDTCGKPVKESSKDDVGTVFYECENGHKTASPTRKAYAPMMYECLTSYQGENGAFNPIAFANDLLNNYFFKTDKKSGIIYIFSLERGIWEPLGEIFIEQATAEKLALEYRQHYLIDIKGYMRASTYADLTETPNKLAVKNGVLNVLTREISPPSPGDFIITKLPITYDATAQCPAILKFLTEVFGEKQLSVVQEIVGYCLYKEMPFHKAALNVGDGANGKSTFNELLKSFLGPENVSNVTLQDLCYNRFASAQQYGKLANLCADLPNDSITSSGRFKMLTGGDTISAEFKHKPAFSFKNYAKMIFSANAIPQVSEDTLAFYRRWIILACNQVFLGENCDPRILEKLTTPQELSGLLNYALEGLKRLLSNGRFSVNETVEEQRGQYIRKSNSAKAFIEERLETSDDSKKYVEEAKLYQNFILFCNDQKLPTMPKRSFTINMQEFCPGAKQTTQRVGGKPGVHVWQYVEIPNVATVAGTLFPEEKTHLNSKVKKPPAPPATKPSIREVLGKVRTQFVEGTKEEWVAFAVEAGMPEKDAKALFERLKGSDLFQIVRDGRAVWRWVR